MDATQIIVFLLTALMGVVGWFLKNVNEEIVKMKDRIDEIESDMGDMKLNYISRFDDAKNHRFEMQTEIKEFLNKIDKKLDIHIAKTEK